MDSCGIDGVESEQQTGERPQKMPLTTAAKQIRPNSALSTASNLPHAHIVEVAAREARRCRRELAQRRRVA
jgi:hypothetical protein